jgi:hypothetical protein
VKRILLLVVVVAMLLAVTVVPASATVHPLAHMECAGDSSNSPVVASQDPPGLTGQSNADNIAQPIFSVLKNPTASENAFKPDICPNQQ